MEEAIPKGGSYAWKNRVRSKWS